MQAAFDPSGSGIHADNATSSEQQQQHIHHQLQNHLIAASQSGSGPPFQHPNAQGQFGLSQQGGPHPQGAHQTPTGGPLSQGLLQNQGGGHQGIGLSGPLSGLSGGPSPGPPAISLLAAAAAAGAAPHHLANGDGLPLELQVGRKCFLCCMHKI